MIDFKIIYKFLKRNLENNKQNEEESRARLNLNQINETVMKCIHEFENIISRL